MILLLLLRFGSSKEALEVAQHWSSLVSRVRTGHLAPQPLKKGKVQFDPGGPEMPSSGASHLVFVNVIPVIPAPASLSSARCRIWFSHK